MITNTKISYLSSKFWKGKHGCRLLGVYKHRCFKVVICVSHLWKLSQHHSTFNFDLISLLLPLLVHLYIYILLVLYFDFAIMNCSVSSEFVFVLIQMRKVWRYHRTDRTRQHNAILLSSLFLPLNGQNKQDKRTNNDLQSTTQKTKNWATLTPRKLKVNSGAP